MTREEVFMSRAIEIANRGAGNVSPNPMVGCVIVYKDKIISESWHKEYGKAHAEVNAINAVSDVILQKSELYVSLEPCSHFGKTPPCANLIIEKKIPKVFIAHQDPNPLVAGKGIEILSKAGVDVQFGILEKEAREMNKRFLCRIEKGRPYIIIKWAESEDGYMALENGKPISISNELSQKYNHKLRAEEDAILVGTNTVLSDNPNLTTRLWNGKNPIRVSLDFHHKFSSESNIFNNESKTIIFSDKNETDKNQNNWVKLDLSKDLIQDILDYLKDMPVNSIIIEGGKTIINQFLEKKLFDEIHIFKSSKKLEKGIKAPNFPEIMPSNSQILKDNRYYLFKNN